jgi:DNA-binding transcriptional regulator GbsR (MarR family)
MDALPAVAERFVEDFALAVEASGMPRTAGRIVALLIMLDAGAELDEIARHLRASRASVSTNTRLLESLGAIERFSAAGQRRIQYRIADFRYVRFTEAALARMRRIQGIARETRRQLPRAMAGARARLERLEEYYEASITTAEMVLARLRKEAGAGGAGARGEPERRKDRPRRRAAARR